ncbi:MAG: hypothetical protein QXU98_05090 [Candidatus Parvarchaeota archaeon]
MPNKNYINGANRERRIMKKLESEGWYCIRSAGSHGVVDIVALRYSSIGKPYVRLIQSKKTGYLTPYEEEKRREVERQVGVTVEII